LKHNYEVIRLIYQDSNCHIIMDCVEGEILGEYILRYPCIEKKQLFAWILQLISQLEGLERVKGISDYRFLTPFYIVLQSDQTIALLNLKAGSNQKLLDRMSANPGMNLFYPPNGTYNDIYSFGKTIQFLLAKTSLTPKLTWREEITLQSIISKCLSEKSKKRYQNFIDIASDFPILKEKKQRKKIIKAGAIAVFILSIIWKGYYNMADNPITEQEEEAYLKLGIAYFFLLEDYEKSRELFKNVEHIKLSQYYQELCSFMLGESDNTTAEMEELLQEFNELAGDNLGMEEMCCLIRVYSKMDSDYARKQLVELGGDVIENSSWEEMKNEAREIVAGIYLKEGEYEKALGQYEVLLRQQHRRELYITVVDLYAKCGKQEKALELCSEGMKYNEGSSELELLYVRLICQATQIAKEEKQERICKIIQNHTELLEEQRFQTLQKEYGLRIEGGEVWLEK